ncbi:hypothetical protein J2X56_001150 [Herbaspirillum sp. 1173]|uniref:DUF3540 domain-containing protein n=1 Tax=Herbaspirillum sp. 1173 TaxID=2817734 RepID=UPI002856C97F|nr:DUF3540 domain-containing protein [Herbaspirillum sp. 1173]MDR6739164.1 hypothetical protein [Herbaspirillum sp. 1173]
MQNTLIPMSRPDAAVGLVYATVTGRADKWFFLSGGDLSVERAQRADSCLIEPESGDTVLVCNGGAQTSYILAVLARATPAQATLKLPGDVSLHTAQGQLQVQAEQLELTGRKRVTVVGAQVELAGVQGDVRFSRLNTSAEEVNARFGVVRSMAQSITSTVGRLVQKARDSFRWVENLDETRAGRVRMQVKERFHMKAKHTTLLADGQVKIDGEKIDLG